MTISFRPTVVGIGRTERDAVAITLTEVERFLGRPYNGRTGDDDTTLITAMRSAGAPTWVGRPHGPAIIDKTSWLLLGPELDPTDDEHYWDDED